MTVQSQKIVISSLIKVVHVLLRGHGIQGHTDFFRINVFLALFGPKYAFEP